MVKEWFWLKMGFSTILTVVIAGFIWIQNQKNDVWKDAYSDFNEMLRESSEMCDAAIQSLLLVLSHETNQKTKPFEFLNMLYPMLNVSKSMYERETCRAKPWNNVEEISINNNFEECLEMIEIEEHLNDILEDMVQSGKEISSIKEKFPDIIEANCSGDEDCETCKLQLLLSVKSHFADLLVQTSVNMKIINEIISVYRKKAMICFDKI